MSLLDGEGRWSAVAAFEMARRSGAEYLAEVEPAAREICSDTVRVDPWRGDDTEFSVCTCPSHQVVCFRGTEPDNLLDWLTDARIYRRRWAMPGRVHLGFASAYEAVQPKLLGWLLPDRPVFVTGHSLGGALATVCAAYLAARGARVAGLYTFGSPRTVDREAAEWLEGALPGRVWRTVNHRDMVTRVPLSRLTGGYWHVGGLAYLDERGRVVHDPSCWELFRSRFPLSPADAARAVLGCAEDHSAALYAERLRPHALAEAGGAVLPSR